VEAKGAASGDRDDRPAMSDDAYLNPALILNLGCIAK
jgi:hypothetical protein